jgi:hypothetical protein
MIAAPVGIKCPECAKQPRSARPRMQGTRVWQAIAAVFVAGAGLGFINLFVLSSVPLIGIIFPWVAGIAIGETVLWAGGRYRGSTTNWIAIGGAVWIYVSSLALVQLIAIGNVDFVDLVASAARAPFLLLGVAIAAFSAYRRVQ